LQATGWKRRIQFSLQFLFIAILVLAVCLVNWQLLLNLSARYFYPFAVSAVVGSCWFVQRLRAPIDDTSPRTPFSIGRVGLLLAATVCIVSLWIRHRWGSFHEDAWPRSFPYPDEFLLLFHDWLDSQYPVEPGYFKIHGEFQTVSLCLDLAAFSLCVVVGAMIGFVSRPTGPIGITYWRDRIVALCRRKKERGGVRSKQTDDQ